MVVLSRFEFARVGWTIKSSAPCWKTTINSGRSLRGLGLGIGVGLRLGGVGLKKGLKLRVEVRVGRVTGSGQACKVVDLVRTVIGCVGLQKIADI